MLGNRASLPAALIRDERQCRAKAAPTKRPLRQGRATTSAGMAMGLERRRLARMLTGVEPRRIFKDAVAGTLTLLPTCSRRCGTDQKARSGTLAGSTRWFLLRGVLAQNIWCLRRAGAVQFALA